MGEAFIQLVDQLHEELRDAKSTERDEAAIQEAKAASDHEHYAHKAVKRAQNKLNKALGVNDDAGADDDAEEDVQTATEGTLHGGDAKGNVQTTTEGASKSQLEKCLQDAMIAHQKAVEGTGNVALLDLIPGDSIVKALFCIKWSKTIKCGCLRLHPRLTEKWMMEIWIPEDTGKVATLQELVDTWVIKELSGDCEVACNGCGINRQGTSLNMQAPEFLVVVIKRVTGAVRDAKFVNSFRGKHVALTDVGLSVDILGGEVVDPEAVDAAKKVANC